MARRLRKKRIAIILLTFTAIIVWSTHSCVSRCTSSSDKEKVKDTLPKAHSQAIPSAMHSPRERNTRRWIRSSRDTSSDGKSMVHSLSSPATTPCSMPAVSDGRQGKGHQNGTEHADALASVSKLITAVGIMKSAGDEEAQDEREGIRT